MNKSQKHRGIFLVSASLIIFLVSACGPGQFLGPTITPSPTFTLTPTITPNPTSTPTPTLTPSPTPVPPTILGELIDTEGAIIGAEITLTSYENEDEVCIEITRSGTTLSIARKEGLGLEECITPPDFASTISGTDGQYRFSNISPGWYRMDIVWKLSKNPRRQNDFEGDFFILYLVSKKTPKEYSGLAIGHIFYFSGKEDTIINFNYENPGY